MPWVEARSLVQIGAAQSQGMESAPSAAPWFIDHDAAADRAVLMEIARRCHRFAPRVGIEDADAPESLLLDVTGVVDWFGGERALEEPIRRDLVGRGFYFRAAFADTIGMAWAVAHFGCDGADCDGGRSENSDSVRGLAAFGGAPTDAPSVPPRVGSAALGADRTLCGASRATDHDQEASLQVWQPRIHALPVDALRLPDETVELLKRLGIEQVGQLVRLPRSELRSRFGPRLLERIDQAAGTMEEVLVDIPTRETPVAEATLEFPTDRYEHLERIIDRLIERVLRTLSVPSHGVLELACQFQCLDAPTVVTTVRLFQPSGSAGHLQELVRLQQPWHRWGGPVSRLRVMVTRSARFEHCQKRLFDDEDMVPDGSQFAALIDRLNGRLGRSAVVRVQLLPDAQPERAWHPVPLVACEETQRASAEEVLRANTLPSKTSRSKRRFSRSSPRRLAGKGRRRKEGSNLPEDSRRGEERLPVAAGLHRPPSLRSVPMIIDPMVVAPDGAPRRFQQTGRWYDVARYWGPERIETAWWRKSPVRRDYYRVEVVTGHRFWLFQRLTDGRWFLQGAF